MCGGVGGETGLPGSALGQRTGGKPAQTKQGEALGIGLAGQGGACVLAASLGSIWFAWCGGYNDGGPALLCFFPCVAWAAQAQSLSLQNVWQCKGQAYQCDSHPSSEVRGCLVGAWSGQVSPAAAWQPLQLLLADQRPDQPDSSAPSLESRLGGSHGATAGLCTALTAQHTL